MKHFHCWWKKHEKYAEIWLKAFHFQCWKKCLKNMAKLGWKHQFFSIGISRIGIVTNQLLFIHLCWRNFFDSYIKLLFGRTLYCPTQMKIFSWEFKSFLKSSSKEQIFYPLCLYFFSCWSRLEQRFLCRETWFKIQQLVLTMPGLTDTIG